MITSLGRNASPFVSCRAKWCMRALATSAHAETSSQSPAPPELNGGTATQNDRVGTKKPPARLFVRPWDGVSSMPDGFAMLRGIEKKYGKIKAFKFSRDREIPSAYLSYFWVELEDPSRYSDASATVLQIPAPNVERRKPGGIGIADLQQFLRPSPEAQEETHEWTGVTERMVDEVDEKKRANKVYDLRLEPSSSSRNKLQLTNRRETPRLAGAFVKWGGFASSLAESEKIDSSTRPAFDELIKRASQSVKAKNPSTPTEAETPRVEEELHKPFNSEFDEPVHSTDTQAPMFPKKDKVPSAQSQSLLAMQREGKRLSKKQQTLLQAAAISRTPKTGENTLAEKKGGGDGEATKESKAEVDEERKQIQDRVWNLIKTKWF